MTTEQAATKPAYATLGVALAGLAVSTYLTVEHYTASVALACPETGSINCAKVTTSKWASIAGVPVAVLGLTFFAVMTVLLLPPLWRRRNLDRVRLAGASTGVAMVVYLIWVELFRVNAICLWCTIVHICTVTLFAGILWHWGNTGPESR